MTRRAWIGFGGVGAALFALPYLRDVVEFPLFYLVFLYFTFFWVGQATSWNILSGYTGYFSFGQGAFFGVGVYTSAVLANRFGVPFFATLPLAGVASMVLALVMGGLAFRLRRLRGEIFALLTLAVAFVLASVAQVTSFIDGGQGLTVSPPGDNVVLGEFSEMVYRLGLVVALLALGAAFAIQHSRFGWGLFAIRDDEGVAEGLGVPTFRYKMLAIAVTGFLAGASGGVHSLQIGYVTVADVFGLVVPLFVILMSVLGGRHHWLGPVIGAAVVFTLQDRLASGGFEQWNQIALGTILILLILFAREGLFGRVRTRALPVVGVFGVTFAVLAVSGAVGGLVDIYAVSLGAGVAALFLPWERVVRRGPPPPAVPEPTADPPTHEPAVR